MVARLSDRPHKNIFFPLLFSAQFAILTYDSPSSPSPSHRSPSTLIVTTALTIALLRRSALIVAAPPSPSSSPSFSSSSSLCSIVSEEYTCVAEADFPIKVEDFFRYFFSDDAVNFNESLHKRCGDKENLCLCDILMSAI
ncbi:uncharacterized protein LOC107638460 isoform X3 [Arachis ipaensis]|uniref:uncharacterized protein LOC107638460 isoform X3 n=1 Tax=Arachis ipaensis TaxID=130454 RepID=UPI0007AF36A3|nr:uncharacterized protein LOC107638460 isoform X3 [Arachis ipaensis]XP_025645595.1 uncharacterized protein LOC112741015 isoform X4 [Arachis hypogaea]